MVSKEVSMALFSLKKPEPAAERTGRGMEYDERDYFIAGVRSLIHRDPELNQKIVAKRASMSPPYLSKILKGGGRGPFVAYMKIAHACGHIMTAVLEIGKAALEGESSLLLAIKARIVRGELLVQKDISPSTALVYRIKKDFLKNISSP